LFGIMTGLERAVITGGSQRDQYRDYDLDRPEMVNISCHGLMSEIMWPRMSYGRSAGGNVSQPESEATASASVAAESETRRLAHGTRHVSAADPSPPAGLFGGEQVRIRAWFPKRLRLACRSRPVFYRARAGAVSVAARIFM
jgi:hypothetical protein